MHAFEVNHPALPIIAATSPSTAMHHIAQTLNPKALGQNQWMPPIIPDLIREEERTNHTDRK